MHRSMRQSVFGALLSLVVGAIYLILTLPIGTLRLSSQLSWSWLADLARWGLQANQALERYAPSFPDLMRYIAYAVGVYLCALLLLSLRHWQMSFFGWGLFFLLVSTSLFHLLAWMGFVGIKVLGFLLWLLGVILKYLGVVIAALWKLISRLGVWVYTIVYRLLQPILGGLWWIAVAILLCTAVFVIVKYWESLVKALKFVLKVLVGLAVIVGLRHVLILLWPIIGDFVLGVWRFLVKAWNLIVRVGRLVVLAVCVLIAIATVGQLLLDQLKGALSAGNKRLGIIIGAIAIGSSIAILLLVSNVYGTDSWLPATVALFCQQVLHQPIPTLDALICLVVVGLSVIGVLRNVPHLLREPSPEEFGKSLVYTAVGVVMAGALTAVGTQTEQ